MCVYVYMYTYVYVDICIHICTYKDLGNYQYIVFSITNIIEVYETLATSGMWDHIW